MARIFIIIGIVLVAVGFLWPWLEKSGIGRLPGDFRFEGENFTFYFPLMTCLLASAVLTLVFWLFNR